VPYIDTLSLFPIRSGIALFGARSTGLLGLREFSFLFGADMRTLLNFALTARGVDEFLLRRIESICRFRVPLPLIRR
jgi:hypothetical protein